MDRELHLELNRREKQRLTEELAELENSLANAHNRIFWAALNLLIVNPLLTAGAVYYFWGKFKQIWNIIMRGGEIANPQDFFSNVKYTAIFLAITFAISSLTLLWYLWKVASLQKQIAKIRQKISRLGG